MEIRPLSDALGAEIIGFDLRTLDDAGFAAVHDALLDRQMLCLRDQHLDAEALIAFSERFGTVVPHDNRQFALKSHPKILVLSNEVDADGNQIGVIDAGDAWHSDHQFKPTPAKCTILYSLKNPSRGGATDFANQYAAYDTLPEETKRRIAGLRGVHSISKLRNRRVEISGARRGATEFYRKQETENPEVQHPLVRVHPETGRPALFCSPRFTVGIAGIPADEGDALLDELFAHATDPAFRYHHEWRDRDLVLWDNRCVNHRATGGYEYPDIRLLHRTTVEGGT